MTYIDYMNQFWKMNQSVEFSSNEVFLYFYLLNECNIRGWQNPFEHPNKTIVLATGMAEKTVIEVRNRLQQKGLINFEAGKRNAKSPVYYLLDVSKTGSKKVSKTVSKEVSKTGNLNTKSKDIKTITPSPTRMGELFPPDEVFDKTIDECYRELKSNQSWMETVCMNTRITHKDFTPKRFYEYLEQFIMEQQNKGVTKKSPADAMSHFANWLKIELKNEKNEKRGSQSRCSNNVSGATNEGETEPRGGIDTNAASLTDWIDSLAIGG